MKYLLTAFLSLFICGFLYAQEEFSAAQGEEVTAVISLQPALAAAAETQALSAAKTAGEIANSAETSALPAEAAVAAVKTETEAKVVKEGESLEEFLKKQEELWLKEKGETPSAAVELSAPSVLAPAANQSDAEQPQAEQEQQIQQGSNAAALPAKPAAQNKASKPAKEPVKKAAKQEQTSTPKQDIAPKAAQEEETLQTPPAPAEKQNWPAFFKGCIFTLILCGVLWLISKYQ